LRVFMKLQMYQHFILVFVIICVAATSDIPDLTSCGEIKLFPGPLRILVYGDSNSDNMHRYAPPDSIPDSTWADFLQVSYPALHIVNESSAGETIRWIMDEANPFGSFNTSIEAVLSRNEPFDLVLIQLGTNDARYAASVDPPDYQRYNKDTVLADMRELVSRIRNHENGTETAVTILAPPPVYNCQGWPDTCCLPNCFASQGYTIATQRYIREMRLLFYDSIARPLGLGFIDLFCLFKNSENTPPFTDSTQHFLFSDGIHFSREGHILVQKKVDFFLENSGWSDSTAVTGSFIVNQKMYPLFYPETYMKLFTLRGRLLAGTNRTRCKAGLPSGIYISENQESRSITEMVGKRLVPEALLRSFPFSEN